MDRAELQDILTRYTEGTATAQERLFVEAYYTYFDQRQDSLDGLDIQLMQNLLGEAEREINRKIHAPAYTAPIHRVHFLKTAWFRIAVAVILFLSVGGYLLLKENTDLQGPVLTQTRDTKNQKDILPGSNRAMLVLGDESVISLDSAKNGVLAQQGGSEIIKSSNGEIIYSGSTNNSGEIFYQKLITPRGGTYQVTLADGTQAWLNAESSIRFPNVFTGQERIVEITGEVFFDVRADKSKPFIARTISDNITVMGTRFNVNAYENHVKTSLVDGAVKINDKILQPGQAHIDGKITATNISQDIAWINGRFDFNDVAADEVIQQLARWYDIKFIIKGNIRDVRFGGGLKRNLTLSQLLRGIEGIGGLHFSVNGKTVTVSK